MPAIVSKTKKNSIAEELQIRAGDEILSIDGEKISDLIDYNFMCKSELLTLEVKKIDGSLEEIELEKEFDEDLGIIFESAVFDKIKPCLNKCIFCFVDQQPSGLRDSLYIKDDDYRLSYLQGTYITLTNLTQKDKDRIAKMKMGPFYVSVHTTNPELRVGMLKNPKASEILNHLKWFDKNQIPLHLQIVLCPKYNDGDELKRTLSDIKKLKNVLSVAIVPVGITKFREQTGDKLYPLTSKIAKETIEIANEFNDSMKKNLVCCSDEFFLLAQKNIPSSNYYGNFSQLEDGVGALRLLKEDFKKHKKKLPKKIKKPLNIVFATSQLAEKLMIEISDELNKINHLHSQVIGVKSDYWGENITVAGLITSEDLIEALTSVVNSTQKPVIIIPSVMLRAFSEDFLDGKTLDYVKQKTGLQFLVIKDCYSTKEIIEFVNSEKN